MSLHAISTSGPQMTTSDFCHFWPMHTPILHELKCKIIALNTHQFQNTANLWMLPADLVFGTFERKYLSCYVTQSCEIFCGLPVFGAQSENAICATASQLVHRQ